MSMMRAAYLVEPGRFELREVPTPEPGPEEVLVRISRTGICGTDIHIFKWDDWAQATIPVPMAVLGAGAQGAGFAPQRFTTSHAASADRRDDLRIHVRLPPPAAIAIRSDSSRPIPDFPTCARWS